jgi:hypothetical protein
MPKKPKAPNPLCDYCGLAASINNSHVVSDFIIRDLKANSPWGKFFFSLRHRRERAKEKDITGSYFCQQCDGVMMNQWETRFSETVYHDPLLAGNQWLHLDCVRFLVCICYRYAYHCFFRDENPAHNAIKHVFHDLAKAALQDPTQIGQSLFIYPYVWRPIAETCEFQNGINHHLTMGFHDSFLLPGEGLPNRYLIRLPKVLLLFSDSNLSHCGVGEWQDLVQLRPIGPFDAVTANVNLPRIVKGKLNEIIGGEQLHQAAANRWWTHLDEVDRKLRPTRRCYQMAAYDQTLKDWKAANCPH